MSTPTKSPEKWVNTTPLSSWPARQVFPQEVCVGSIVWLRQRFDGDEDLTCVRAGHCDGKVMLEEGYRHPVVILKIWQRPGSVVPGDLMLGVSDMTSFKESDLRTYAKHQYLIKFAECIPISHPGEDRIEGFEELSLSSGQLKCKSYVRLQHMWQVPIRSVWKYSWHVGSHAYTERLTEESYTLLMSRFGIEKDTYDSVQRVLATADERLQGLADQERKGMYGNTFQDEGGFGVGNTQGSSIDNTYSPNPPCGPRPSTFPQEYNLVAHQPAQENTPYSNTTSIPSAPSYQITTEAAAYGSPFPAPMGQGTTYHQEQFVHSSYSSTTTPSFQQPMAGTYAQPYIAPAYPNYTPTPAIPSIRPSSLTNSSNAPNYPPPAPAFDFNTVPNSLKPMQQPITTYPLPTTYQYLPAAPAYNQPITPIWQPSFQVPLNNPQYDQQQHPPNTNTYAPGSTFAPPPPPTPQNQNTYQLQNPPPYPDLQSGNVRPWGL